jgi:hypothetical protein
MDCAGICFGDSVTDDCGDCVVPDDFNAALDCAGTCDGSAFVDDCGVCSDGASGHDPNSDMDCAGVCDGSAEFDNCDVCDDDPLNDCAQDCAGVWGGDSLVDDCDVCGGTSFTDFDMDGFSDECDEYPWGEATLNIGNHDDTAVGESGGTRTRVVRNLSTAAIRFVRKVKVRWSAPSGVVPVTIEMGCGSRTRGPVLYPRVLERFDLYPRTSETNITEALPGNFASNARSRASVFITVTKEVRPKQSIDMN